MSSTFPPYREATKRDPDPRRIRQTGETRPSIGGRWGQDGDGVWPCAACVKRLTVVADGWCISGFHVSFGGVYGARLVVNIEKDMGGRLDYA